MAQRRGRPARNLGGASANSGATATTAFANSGATAFANSATASANPTPSSTPAGARDSATPNSHLGDFVPRSVRRRFPELAMGLGLVALGAILMVVFVGGSDPTRQVLALARNVNKGEFLATEDMTQIALPTDVPIAVLDAPNQTSLIGSQTVGDLPAGTVLTPQLLAPRRALPEGMVVIGAQLGPGQYPVRHFRAGETVNLLARTPSGDTRAIATGVQIYEVAQLGSNSNLFVSFLVDEALQTQVASVLGDESLRLGLLGADA